MVKAHCVIITAQVDINLIVVCDGVTAVKEESDDDDDDANHKIFIDLDGGWC